MEKYGYKNISSRNEFEKTSSNSKKVNQGPVVANDLTSYGFVDLNKKGNWGMPGETRYFVKNIEDLINASDNVNKPIMRERKPKGYVGW